MERAKFMLAAMTPAGSGSFSPVQVQKLFFLLDENVAKPASASYFDFKPYDYGPFDKEVYAALNKLEKEGFVEVSSTSDFNIRTYRLTDAGLSEGRNAFAKLPEPVQEYNRNVVNFVRSLSFAKLVSAIYQEYPEMRENSVFVEAPQ